MQKDLLDRAPSWVEQARENGHTVEAVRMSALIEALCEALAADGA